MKYNSVKYLRQHTESSRAIRHKSAQESPLPIYVGLMLHAQTRKKDLVDKLFSLGLSISYSQVLHLSAEMGNSLCQLFHMEQVVCPPMLRKGLFTTSAIDNIDHNSSATTAKDSFHSIGISLMQHPTSDEETVVHSATVVTGAGSRTVAHLPSFYTEVPTYCNKCNTQLYLPLT